MTGWLLVVMLAGAGCLLLWCARLLRVLTRQDRYVFARDATAEPDAPAPGGCREVQVETSDGLRLMAWYSPAPLQQPVILVCHGNAGNLSRHLALAQWLKNAGVGFMLFDYRGYGRSEGCPTEAGLYLDVEACYRFLVHREGVPPGKLVVMGHSLGAAVASHLAARVQVAGLVMESAFRSIPEMARLRFPWLPVARFCRYAFDNMAHVASVQAPIMVAHSRTDETCPYSHGCAIYEAATSPKRFVEMQGGHNDGGVCVDPAYARLWLAFVRSVTQDH